MDKRILITFYVLFAANALADNDDQYASLKKKSILDYSDADMERLFEQWEVCRGLLRASRGCFSMPKTCIEHVQLPSSVFASRHYEVIVFCHCIVG